MTQAEISGHTPGLDEIAGRLREGEVRNSLLALAEETPDRTLPPEGTKAILRQLEEYGG